MNQRMSVQQIIPLLIALVAVAVFALVAPHIIQPPAVGIASVFAPERAVETDVEAVDSAHAADLSAARWQAMARYYEAQGLLTRDPFDYEQAAENQAARWLAMGQFYKDRGLLTRDDFDYEQAADTTAFRWQAMGKAYENLGLLNYRSNPDDLSAYRWQAMAKFYEKNGLLNE